MSSNDLTKHLSMFGDVVKKLAETVGSDHNEAIAKETAVDYHQRNDRVIVLPGLPDRMDVSEAASRLLALAAHEGQEYTIHEQIPGLPLDAAHAFVQVIRKRYGWAETKQATKYGMFGPFKTKPGMHRVNTGPNPDDYVEVPIGDFELTDISSKIETGFERSSSNRFMAAFYVEATVKHQDRKLIMEMIGETKKILATNSIYRGKAMRLRVDSDGNINSNFEPEFIDVTGIDETTLVHPQTTEMLLNTGLWTPIRKLDACRKHNIPLKRTALLSGPYGTGKSLTASVTAKLGIQHGWTFISVDNAKGLKHALEFAKRYQPAVVFAEDIDRIMSERDEKANDLLNIIDGVLDKSVEVITVLTTNHIEKIEPAMLRPGRIDVMVNVGHPDAEAACRLVKVYGRDLVPDDVDLTRVGAEMDGFIPAAIREVIERGKLSMLMEGRETLTENDLLSAAIGMKVHAELSSPRVVEKSDEEKLGDAMSTMMAKSMNGIREQIGEIHEATV